MQMSSIILRMLADEIDHNNALQLECAWAAQTIAALVEENGGLRADLDDLQAEWAEDASSKAAGLSLFSTELTTAQNRKHSELALADARIAELEALDRQQVAHVDELVAENERLSVANEHQRASLDRLDSLLLERTREYAAVHNELLEERRQKVAAFERNAELEGREKRLLSALERLVRVFDLGEVAYTVINGRAPSALEDAREAIAVCGPRAPSVPRHRFPNEAEAPL